MLNTGRADADHFHEECGVFGIYGHPDAAALSELKTKIDDLKKKVTEELKQLEELKKKYAAMGGK